MEVYQTDREGFFVGIDHADPDPLTPGEWLIPGGCVLEAPPPLQEGKRALWLGNRWRVVNAAHVPTEPEPTPPTPEDMLDAARSAIDAHVEAQARALMYNSAAHIAGYAASTVPQWRAEALAFVAWRDQVWLTAVAMLDATDPLDPPTICEVIDALPAWAPPEAEQ